MTVQRDGCVRRFVIILLSCIATNAAAESWCDAAPAAEFAALEAVDVRDDWFKVHKVAPGVFSITEARQYEGVTSFLVVGSQRAVLFDSGLGVARIGRRRAEADGAAGDRDQFAHAFRSRRRQRRVHRRAQPRLIRSAARARAARSASRCANTRARRSSRSASAGRCPPASRAAITPSRRGGSRPASGTPRCSNSGTAGSKSCAHPGIPPIRSACSTGRTDCCSPATPITRARSTSGRRKRMWRRTRPRSTGWPASSRG